MSLQALLDDAVKARRTPGAAALVRTRGGARIAATSGTTLADGAGARVGTSTVYDLASLTKLLCTTLLAARAVDERKLALDEAPWPRWPGVSVEHVLRHSAGLPAWRNLFELAEAHGPVGLPAARAFILDEALRSEPIAAPGERTLYSDIGFIALGALLEERLGAALDDAFAAHARARFGETGLGFVRLADTGFHPAVPRVAASERCPWRRRLVIGQPHDENCYAMGGVSGHAGLFGSLEDVERAGLFLLEAIARGGTLARFAQLEGEERGLGFDRATPGGATGDVLGARAVGHLGFTGTSLWIDPDLDGGALFVLLTNHVHFGRDAQRIKALRQDFHRAAVEELRATARA
jgi:serine-type D-Ala-D-Ala carboxypeptidase